MISAVNDNKNLKTIRNSTKSESPNVTDATANIKDTEN